jgi:hypothetical protein
MRFRVLGGRPTEPTPVHRQTAWPAWVLTGDGVKRACESRLDLERDEIGPGSAPVNDSEPALPDT